MIELWPFQKTLIQALRQALTSRYRSPLLVSPTGSGKTVMFAYLTSKLAASGLRTVILAHRKELLDQISATLDDFKVFHGIVAPGVKYAYHSHHPVHVASVLTIVRRLEWVIPPDYVIVDEAHHVIAGSTWSKVLKHWWELNPKMRLIGVTATPERLSGEGLDDIFDNMVLGPTVAELINSGHLSPYRMFAPPRAVDTSQLHRRMGDFIRKEAEELMDRPSIMGDAISHYKKHLNGAPCIGFCISINHAESVAASYRSNGFQAVHISGKTPKLERRRIIKDFGLGKINYLASCDLISEGLDVPGAMGCQNLRPTESLALCLQQWGRTLRYQDGKTAIILDHVGNSARHGLPDQDREWSLKGRPKKKGKRDPDDIAIRQCGACGAVNDADATECDECGTEFEKRVRQIEEVEGTLEEIREAEKLKFKQQRGNAKDLAALTEIGRMRGMKNPAGWAGHVMAAREKKKARFG